MGMQTDVKSAVVSTTGTVYAGRTRVKGLLVAPSTGPGLLVVRDGGGSGTIKLSIPTTANGEPFSVIIPGEGILFENDVYAAVSDCIANVFYG
jgi:hypothetical protein